MSKDQCIPNILASRYASEAMRRLWSQEGRVRLERDFWIAVLKGQQDLGLPVAEGAIESYERVREKVDMASIRQRETASRHDVKARIDEFNALAGFEEIHKGLTSRDLTESVEQLQVFRALRLVQNKAVATLRLMAERAQEFRDLLMTARTHNVAAQPTTFGKRIAMFGSELLYAVERCDALLGRYPARGLKGAVGTQVDMLTLFDGDAEKVRALERKIFSYLDIWNNLRTVGQIYPRSLDADVLGALHQLACGPSSFAMTLRLMAGHELAGEGFLPGQTGSSAMPHKMNARSCERINGFKTLLDGYQTMAESLAGRQWNEGDVSCSVVRRVMLPDAFFALDGLLETILTVLRNMEVYAARIAAENARYLPFLASTTFLMESVRAGVGREQAHKGIKEHALAAARQLMQSGATENDLLERLTADESLRLSRLQLEAVLEDARRLTGNAAAQVDAFVGECAHWIERYPESQSIEPEPIL